MEEVKEKSLWKQLIENVQKTVDNMLAPLLEKKTKRKFSAAHDDAERQLIDLKKQYITECSKLDELDVNSIIEIKTKIKQLENCKTEIAAAYKELFDCELEV
jgi:replicative DNA helicase